jgi:hypothetical protein
MKKIIVFCILVCTSVSLLAQTINDMRTAAERGDAEAQCALVLSKYRTATSKLLL